MLLSRYRQSAFGYAPRAACPGLRAPGYQIHARTDILDNGRRQKISGLILSSGISDSVLTSFGADKNT